MPDPNRAHGVTGLTAGEPERARRDMRTGPALIRLRLSGTRADPGTPEIRSMRELEKRAK
jgi:hypothetical protein